jgi:hypothetical protein
MSPIFVPVVDQEHTPLMPTTPSRARRWIRSGKATGFWKGGFFCVRLNVEQSAREQQPVALGIDPGSKREGIVVASATHTYANVHTEARTGVKEAEQDGTRMRRNRRQRKTPCRKPRQNRKQSRVKLPPSTRARWHWKLRLAAWLCQLFPVSVFVVEDIKATTRGKKLAEVWEAHCIDAWVLAYSAVGGQQKPDNTRLVYISPLAWHHRQLHRFQPEKGGKRKPYGGTLSLGIKRGTLVKHPKWGKAYVGGTMDGQLSLHDLQTGKRLSQSAKVVDCRLIKVLRWKTRLVPLSSSK